MDGSDLYSQLPLIIVIIILVVVIILLLSERSNINQITQDQTSMKDKLDSFKFECPACILNVLPS